MFSFFLNPDFCANVPQNFEAGEGEGRDVHGRACASGASRRLLSMSAAADTLRGMTHPP